MEGVVDDSLEPVPVPATENSMADDEGLWPPYCNPLYVMPTEIEVKVAMTTGEYYFPVSISKFKGHKAYLGGFRNTVTGSLYHHGSSQTPTENKFEVKDTSNLRSRETQTYEYKTLSVQSVRECGTQMQRQDVSIDTKKDIVLTPRRYFTSIQLIELKIVKCVIIQRCWRGCMARALAAAHRIKNLDHQTGEAELLATTMNLDKEQRNKDMMRRLHPISDHDFEILYNELDAWRKAEAAKIKSSTVPGEERVRLMTLLLANETKSLQSIQKLKVSAQKDGYVDKTNKILELMAKPYRWQLSNGTVTTVSTQATTKASELLELYRALGNTEVISVDERLDVLYKLKQTVQTAAADYHKVAMPKKNKSNSNISLLRDIVDLVDREGDMLNRDRPVKTLESMRKRLNNLFLQYIENPIFNPRAIEFINIPKGTQSIGTDTMLNDYTDTQGHEQEEYGTDEEGMGYHAGDADDTMMDNEFGSTAENMQGGLPAPPAY